MARTPDINLEPIDQGTYREGQRVWCLIGGSEKTPDKKLSKVAGVVKRVEPRMGTRIEPPPDRVAVWIMNIRPVGRAELIVVHVHEARRLLKRGDEAFVVQQDAEVDKVLREREFGAAGVNP